MVNEKKDFGLGFDGHGGFMFGFERRLWISVSGLCFSGHNGLMFGFQWRQWFGFGSPLLPIASYFYGFC